jgi:hypothetical protein
VPQQDHQTQLQTGKDMGHSQRRHIFSRPHVRVLNKLGYVVHDIVSLVTTCCINLRGTGCHLWQAHHEN